jgi:hypothetical protein
LPYNGGNSELVSLRAVSLRRGPLELVLEYEQVVGGGDRDDALVRMPRRVQDFLVEVQTIYTDFVL